MAAHYVDWVIVGAETGHRKDKVIPKRDWIRSLHLIATMKVFRCS